MSDPRKASSVWPEMSCMRGPEGAERLQRLVPLLRANRDACAARRDERLNRVPTSTPDSNPRKAR